MKFSLKGILGNKSMRGNAIFILLTIAGLLLLFLGRGIENDEAITSSSSIGTTIEDEEKRIEEKIRVLCNSVSGVGEVKVSVTLEHGTEAVYASSDGGYLTVGSGASKNVVYLTEKPPKIKGIGIVCDGGADSQIESELLSLISAAYGIPTHKIYIAAAK